MAGASRRGRGAAGWAREGRGAWVMRERLPRRLPRRPPQLPQRRLPLAFAALGDQRGRVARRGREAMHRPARRRGVVVAVPGPRLRPARAEHELERRHALREPRAGRLDERLLAAPDGEERLPPLLLAVDGAQAGALPAVEKTAGHPVASAGAP